MQAQESHILELQLIDFSLSLFPLLLKAIRVSSSWLLETRSDIIVENEAHGSHFISLLRERNFKEPRENIGQLVGNSSGHRHRGAQLRLVY